MQAENVGLFSPQFVTLFTMRSAIYGAASLLAIGAPAFAAENYTWANSPSEVPYYGLSPPVYPTRKSSIHALDLSTLTAA